MISDFRPQIERRYFTIYFLPVFPISKAEPVLTCCRCGATFYAKKIRGEERPDKAVLVCPGCSGQMRVPVRLENAIRVTCPHCREQFTVSVDRG